MRGVPRVPWSRPQDTPRRELAARNGALRVAEDYIRALRGKALIAHEVDRALDGLSAGDAPLPFPRRAGRREHASKAVPSGALADAALHAAFNLSGIRDLLAVRRRPPACRLACSSWAIRDVASAPGGASSGTGDRRNVVIRDYFHRWSRSSRRSARARGWLPVRVGREWIDELAAMNAKLRGAERAAFRSGSR